jgi:non-ribosomal peptide synthetase component E (peptide arylation enzyme)
MATGKRLYNLVTRRIMGYVDREGGGDAVAAAPEVAMRIAALPGVSAAAVVPYPTPRGARLYAFVEAAPPLAADEVRARLRGNGLPVPGLVQIARKLPRDAEGRVREDLLRLIAQNQVDLIELLALDARSRAEAAELVDNRLNRADRRLK